jgi:hypothetical protein
MKRLFLFIAVFTIFMQGVTNARGLDSLEVFPAASVQLSSGGGIDGMIVSSDGKTLTVLYGSNGKEEVDSAWYRMRGAVRVWDMEKKEMILERAFDTYGYSGYHCAHLWGDSTDLNVVYVDRRGDLLSMNIASGDVRTYGINVRKRITTYIDASLSVMFWRPVDINWEKWKSNAIDLRSGKVVSSEFPAEWIDFGLGQEGMLSTVYCVPKDTLGDTVIMEIRRFRDRGLQRTIRARLGSQPSKGMLLRFQSGSLDLTNTETGRESHVRYGAGIRTAVVSGIGDYVIFADSTDVLMAWNTADNSIDTITKNFVNTVLYDSLEQRYPGIYEVFGGKQDLLAYCCQDSVFYYSVAGRRRISATFVFQGISQDMMGIDRQRCIRFSFNYPKTPYTSFRRCIDTLGREATPIYNARRYWPDEDTPQWILREGFDDGSLYTTSATDLSTTIVSLPPVVLSPLTVFWHRDKERLMILDDGSIKDDRVIHYDRRFEKTISELRKSAYEVLYASASNKVFIRSDSAIYYAHADSMEKAVRLEGFTRRDVSCMCLSEDEELFAIGDVAGNCHLYSVEPFEKIRVIKLPGRIERMIMKGKNQPSALVVFNSGIEMMVYDATFDSVLYSSSGYKNLPVRFSPTGRYLLTTEDIRDTKTWRSVYIPGGDYDVPIENAAFLYNDSIFARSTKDFGVYLLDLQNYERSSYKKLDAKVYFNEKRGTAYSIDSINTVRFMHTSDWTVRSSVIAPNGILSRIDADYRIPVEITLNPYTDAIAFRNSIGSLCIWYPLTSTVTSVPEESIEPTHALRGDPQAVSIRCRNGTAQLVVETEPETNSLRVVDVLGREVAFTMENRTLRLVNCRPGYHAITYRHAGHSVNIPVMVVEE